MFAATPFSPWVRSIRCRNCCASCFATEQRHHRNSNTRCQKPFATTSAAASSRRPSSDTRWQTALAAATSAVPFPSPRTVASTIVALGKARQWQYACAVIALLPADTVDIVCYNSLLTCLVRSDQPSHALRVFDALPDTLPRTSPTFGALISACAAMGHWERALHVVRHVMPTPNAIAYTSAIRASANAEGGARWDVALALLDAMVAERVDPTAVTYGTVLDALAKAAESNACSWERAVALLDTLGAEATVVHYGATLHACAMAGKWRVALSLIGRMEKSAVRPNVIAHNSVLHALSVGGNWRHCLKTLATMHNKDVISVNTAIMACAQAHEWRHALQLLKQYDARYTDVVSYNGAIQACGRARQWARALSVFNHLTTTSSLTPTPQSFHAILSALAACGQWERAVHIFNHMGDVGQPRPAIHAVLTACADGRAWQYALSFMSRTGSINDPAAVSNVMAACVRAGEWHQALNLFDRMVSQKNTETGLMDESLDRIAYTLALHAASRARPKDIPLLLASMQETFGYIDAAAYAVALRGTFDVEESFPSIAHSALDACERWASGVDPSFVREPSHALQLLSLLPQKENDDSRRLAFVTAVWTQVLWPLIGHLKAGDVDAVRRVGIPTVGAATRDVLECLGIGTFDATGVRAAVAHLWREEKEKKPQAYANNDGTYGYEKERLATHALGHEGRTASLAKADEAGQPVRARDVVVHVKSAHGERIFRYGQPQSANPLPSVFLHHDRSGHAEQHALFDLLQREGCTSRSAVADTAYDVVQHGTQEASRARVELYVTHRPCVSCLCAFAAFQKLAPHYELAVMFDELDCD